MFKVTVENFRGERLQLTQNPSYILTRVDGLHPPDANINTATNATFDGSMFKSSKVRDRNIVLQIVIDGRIEANRIALYRFFPPKRSVRLYVENGTRAVYIDGYVESFDISLFEQRQAAQVSILCPKPYFLADTETDAELTSVFSLFEFPFSIPEEGIEFSTLQTEVETTVVNYGEVASGMVIQFTALGTAANPTFYNVETSEHIKANVSMTEGDILTIDTRKGEKSITLDVAGVVTNEINKLDSSSKWLQLEVGDNVFLYTAETNPENLVCHIMYNSQYLGV